MGVSHYPSFLCGINHVLLLIVTNSLVFCVTVDSVEHETLSQNDILSHDIVYHDEHNSNKDDLRSPEDFARCHKLFNSSEEAGSTHHSWVSNVTGCSCECEAGELICIRQCAPRKTGQMCLPPQPGHCCERCIDVQKTTPKRTSCVEAVTGKEHSNQTYWRDPSNPCSLCHCLDGEPHCTEPLCHAACPAGQKAQRIPGTCCDFVCPRTGHQDMFPQCLNHTVDASKQKNKVYGQEDTFIKNGDCTDEMCQCLNSRWHCSLYCTPLHQLPCLATEIDNSDPVCCRRCKASYPQENETSENIHLHHHRFLAFAWTPLGISLLVGAAVCFFISILIFLFLKTRRSLLPSRLWLNYMERQLLPHKYTMPSQHDYKKEERVELIILDNESEPSNTALS